MGSEPQLTAAEWAHPEVLFEFLDELREQGFNLGTAHYAAAQDLALILVAKRRTAVAAGLWWQGQLGEQAAQDRLARLLGPLLCSTPREQEALPRLLARWAAGPGRALIESLSGTARAAEALAPAQGRSEARSQAEVPSLAGVLKRIEQGTRLWMVLVAASLLIVGIGVLVYHPAPQGLRQHPTAAGGGSAASLPAPALGWWWLAAAGVMASTYLCWRLWLSLLGRQFLVRRSMAGAPARERLTVHTSSDELFARQALRRSAEQLRRRVSRPGSDLDLEATVDRTARQGGWPTPVAGRRLVRPEYLVLIERITPGDQRSRFFDELTERLAKQGVVLERAYFDGDPRTCFRVPRAATGRGSVSGLVATGAFHQRGQAEIPPETEAAGTANVAGTGAAASPLSLRELYSLYPEHRLLMVSDGEGLFSPISGEEEPWVDQLLAWQWRAVLVPRPVEQWGRRESALARHFAVVPATLAGWAEVAAIFEGQGAAARRTTTEARLSAELAPAATGEEAGLWAPLPEELRLRPALWLERNPPEPWRVEKVLDGLERSMGDAGFYWLAACAVYPALDWDLTIALGQTLTTDDGKPLHNTWRLGTLLDLPWMRRGRMPDWLRQRLLARLPRRREAQVRAALEALLLSVLQGGDPRAEGAFTLDLAGRHRRSLARLWRSVWRRLSWRGGDQGPARDYVFRDFMAGRRRQLGVALPVGVARLLGRRRYDVAEAEVWASPAMRRARRTIGWLLALGPVAVLCLDLYAPHWLNPTGLTLVGSGIALMAIAYIWQRPRLAVTGAYWGGAAFLPMTVRALSGLQLQFLESLPPLTKPLLKAAVLGIGLLVGRRIGPLVFVHRSERLVRVRRVLVLASAAYAAAGFEVFYAGWSLDNSQPFTVASAGVLLAIAYSERSALLAVAAAPIALPYLEWLAGSYSLLPYLKLPFFLLSVAIGLAAGIMTWLRLRPSVVGERPMAAPTPAFSRLRSVRLGLGRPGQRMTLNRRLSLLLVLLFALFVGTAFLGRAKPRSSPNTIISLLGFMFIIVTAVLCAVYPKDRWRFARRKPLNPRPIPFYFAAGVLAAASSVVISVPYLLLFGAARQIQVGSLWREGLSAFVVAFMVAWMSDDQPPSRWSRRRLRWTEGLVAGAGLGVTMVAIVSTTYPIRELQSAFVVALVMVFAVFDVMGFVIGFLIPTWYRDGVLDGTWSGTVDQLGGGRPRSYGVVMRLDSKGGGSTEYPSLECGGSLLRLSDAGGSYSYRETITHGRCLDGTITFRLLAHDTMSWSWRGSWQEEAISVSGNLTKITAEA